MPRFLRGRRDLGGHRAAREAQGDPRGRCPGPPLMAPPSCAPPSPPLSFPTALYANHPPIPRAHWPLPPHCEICKRGLGAPRSDWLPRPPSPRAPPTARVVTGGVASDWPRLAESRARRGVRGGAGKAHEGSRTRGRPARNAPFRRASRTARANHYRAGGREQHADWSEPCMGGVAFWKVLGGYKRAARRAQGIDRAGAELRSYTVGERETGPGCG